MPAPQNQREFALFLPSAARFTLSGPSSEATGSTDDSYKKPEYTSYPKESPDSSYRQSSVKDSDISEDE